jgi:antitoxin component YwqK of YwqJK toxin-antitoxin module
MDGPWFRYSITGQLWLKETYKNGKKNGPFVSYYSNGQVWSEGTFKDGERDGLWVSYHDNGTVNDVLTGTYKDGVKVE